MLSTCLSLIAFMALVTAQETNEFIQVSAPTKHEFTIHNVSDINLQVDISGIPQPFELTKKTSKRLSNSGKIKPSVQVFYLIKDFKEDTSRIAQDIRSRLAFSDMWSEIIKYTNDLEWGEAEKILQQYALSPNTISLFKEIRNRDAMCKASYGTKNEWSPQFTRFSIKSEVNIKQGVAPMGALLVGFPVRRQGLNDFWGKKSSRGAHEFIFNGRLFVDKRLGQKSTTFFNAYWFVGRERISYGLQNSDGQNFFVGEDYVSTDASGFFPLTTTEKVNLTQKRWSAGAFLRWSFFPKIYFDVGAGYYVLQNIELEFDNRETEDGIVQHLGSSNELERNKFKKIATLDNPYFGLIRIGLIPIKGKTKKSVLSSMGGYDFALSCKISPPRNITANDDFHLYTQEAGQFVTVPLSADAEEKIDLQFNFSIGFTF